MIVDPNGVPEQVLTERETTIEIIIPIENRQMILLACNWFK